MQEEFSAKLTGRFVDDDDIVRTGRAMLELDGFNMLHLPIPTGYKEQLDGMISSASSDAAAAKKSEQAAAKSAASAKQDANKVANTLENTFWTGDRLAVNGKISPPLTGKTGSQGPPGEVTKQQLDTAIATAITALAPTGLKIVLAAPDEKTAEQADTAIRAKGYQAVVVVPAIGSWWE